MSNEPKSKALKAPKAPKAPKASKASNVPKATKKDSDLVEVLFELDPSEVHEHQSETMLAQSVGPDRYCLENAPFYAYGYSRHDVVEATLNDAGVPVVRRLVKPSGHSTYRIIIAQRRTSHATFEEYWELLGAAGCRYELADERYLTIDVPPEANIHDVYGQLEEGESAGAWYFEEAHCGHLGGG